VCRRPLPRHGIGTAQRPWREPPTSRGWSRSIKGAHLIETAIHLPNQAETDYRDRPRKRLFSGVRMVLAGREMPSFTFLPSRSIVFRAGSGRSIPTCL
jgi:hypothetical protein